MRRILVKANAIMTGVMIWLAGYCVFLARIETEIRENRHGNGDRWWGLPVWLRGLAVTVLLVAWPVVVIKTWMEEVEG